MSEYTQRIHVKIIGDAILEANYNVTAPELDAILRLRDNLDCDENWAPGFIVEDDQGRYL